MAQNEEYLKELCSNALFINLGDKYIPLISEQGQTSYFDFLTHRLENINNTELLVPVLGIQGSGKSSILNALLMDDIVLPVDACETTCVPVEIRFGTNDGEILIFIKDQADPLQITDHKLLNQYVDNANNPGNEKQVSHVVIYKNNQLLANGLILVDLPGVESMTPQNVNITMDYINKLSAAIFLLRTTPPITRSEKLFLTVAWPKLTRAWFVQNQWNDESDFEVNEGKEHNLYVLQQITEKHNTSKDIDIMIVNIYKALVSRLTNNEVGYYESGIGRIRELLESLSQGWKVYLENELISFLKHYIESIKSRINELLAQSKLSEEELRRQLNESEQEFASEIHANNQRIARIEEMILEYKINLQDFSTLASKKQEQNLRSEMRRIIGGGLSDGTLLNRAFRDQQNIAYESALYELVDLTAPMQKNLENEMEEINIPDINGHFESYKEFSKKESFKWEKALPSAGSIGGGVLGAWAGLKTGAIVGAAVGGPVGIVVGGIVGIGITLFGSWLGSKAKKGVSDVRSRYTMADIEPLIQSFKKDLKTHIENVSNEIMENILEALNEMKTVQDLQLKKKKQKNRDQMQKQKDGFQSYVNELNNDLENIMTLGEGIPNG